MRRLCKPGGTKSATGLKRNHLAMVSFIAALIVVGISDQPTLRAQNTPAVAAQKLTDFHQIHRRFTNGTVRVIVTLEPPVKPTVTDFRSPARRAVLRSQMRQTQQAVLNTLPAAGVKVGFRFDNIAGFSAEVTTNGLQALQAHPGVVTIEPVMELQPHLAQGIALIRGMTYRSSYNGDGVAIAICDTGIDYTHPRLGGGGFPNSKVIGGYDFGDDDSNPMPSAQAHGTCCAGIAAGDLGTVGDYIGGVAYNAKLYALKISSGTSGSAATADMVAAWDWCVTHQDDDPAHPIMVISTSFGGGQYASVCDSTTPSMTTAANNAVAAGITVLASSGNDGYCNAMGWPACISSVISVGAVYDASFGNLLPCVSSASCAPKIASSGCATGYYVNDTSATDKVTAYANVASFLTLFAPAEQCYTLDIVGTSGYSAGDYDTAFGGTSAACPYAAGAVACLQSAAKAITGDFLTPAAIKDLLTTYGDNVTDTKVAVTKPRVNLERAILSFDTNTVANFTANQTNGAWPFTVNFTSLSTGATNFAWNFGDGKTSTVVNPLNTYSNSGIYTVSLTVIGAGGTNSLTKTNYITVTNPPPPTVNFTGNPTTGGAPRLVTFVNSTTGATNYNWNFGDGKSSSATNPSNTYTNAGSYTVALTAIGPGGTSALTRTNYIVVTNVAPVIVTQPLDQLVNAGSNVTFVTAATGTPPLGYQWRLNGMNIPGATAASYTRTNVQIADMGLYSVVVSNLASSVASSNATLLVIVSPGIISVTGIPYQQNFDSMGASGTTTPFGWYVGTGSGAISSTTVTAGTGSSGTARNYNFGSSGSTDRALGSVAAASTQRDSEARFVNLSGASIRSININYTGEQWRRGGNNAVNNQLVLQYSTDGDNFTDLGAAFDFDTPIDSGSGSALNGNAAANRVTDIGGEFTPAAPITNGEVFYLRWADPDDSGSDHGIAVDDLVLTFTLTNLPPVITAQPHSTAVTLGSNATFTVIATGETPLAYQWRFNTTNLAGATSTALTLTNVQTSNAGGYSVVVSNVGGVTTSAVATLTVFLPPQADFTGAPTNGLAPLAVTFTNLSLNATNFAWDFGDGHTSTNANPVNTYTNAGSFAVTLTAVGAGGTNTLARTSYVVATNLPPLASFTGHPTSGFAPLNVVFSNLSTHAVSYLWNFGDGNTSTNAHPANLYSNAGSYTVTLAAIGPGGTNLLTQPGYIVVTNHPPLAGFSGNPTSGYAPLTVTFSNLSLNTTEFAWDFGDGQTSTNAHPVNTYSNAGIYSVMLTAVGAGGTNALTLTNYIVVTNYPPPLADFVADITNGLAPLTVTFSNLSLNATEFTWDFGDGQTSTNVNPVNTYSNAGSYAITLTAIGAGGTNILTLTDYIVITNHLAPVADFVADITHGLAPLTVTFSNLSLNATEFAWDFGDGQTSTNANPVNTYSNAGNHAVTLTAIGVGGTNALTLTNYIVVTNFPPPLADFVADITNGLTPLTVTFSNLSLNATDFAWDFGDGQTSTNVNPSNVYSNAGSYSVSLTAVGAGGTNALVLSNYIVVTNFPPPVAEFAADTTNGLVSLIVTFTNLSLNAAGFEWDFGDGNTSTNVNPANIYSNAGNYTVTLTAIGTGGTNTLALTNYIVVTNYPAPLASFVADSTNGLAPLTVTFANVSQHATEFTWDFGDGNTSTNANPANTYTNAGTYSVSLTAAGAGGTNTLALTNYILVLNPALMLISPATLDLGNVLTGRLAHASFVVSNAGDVTLSANATVTLTPFALLDPTSNAVASLAFDVPTLGTTNLTVRFAPDHVGSFSNVVVFLSNGGNSTKSVQGVGVGAPLILCPAANGADFVFVFDTAAGLNYEVQFKDSLDDPVWQTLQSVPGDGAQKFITNSVAIPGQRFYRLRVE